MGQLFSVKDDPDVTNALNNMFSNRDYDNWMKFIMELTPIQRFALRDLALQRKREVGNNYLTMTNSALYYEIYLFANTYLIASS